MALVTHPFTKPTADIILRSSDNVDFRVHKVILSEASSVFEGMFSLPQPPASVSGSQDVVVDGLTAVSFTETGKVLEYLLRFCYPIPDPELETLLDDVEPVITAALKYDIEVALQVARKRLVDPRFLEGSSLLVYSIAWRHKLEPETAMAAKRTLKRWMPQSLTLELSAVPPAALYHLMDYRARCLAAGLNFIWTLQFRADLTQYEGLVFDEWDDPDGDFESKTDTRMVCYEFICEACDNNRQAHYVQVARRSIQEDLAKMLQQSPCGASITDIDCLTDGVQLLGDDGDVCAGCRRSGTDNIQDLCRALEREIDSKIASVPFRKISHF